MPPDPAVSPRAVTDKLLSMAAVRGGRLQSTDIAAEVRRAGLTPTQAKKVLRGLSDAGAVIMVVPPRQRRSVPPMARRRLGKVLHGLREARGMTVAEVATALGWSESKISRFETAHMAASAADLTAILAQVGAADEVADAVLQLGRDARRRRSYKLDVATRLLRADPTHFFHNFAQLFGNGPHMYDAFVEAASNLVSGAPLDRPLTYLVAGVDNTHLAADFAEEWGETLAELCANLLLDRDALIEFGRLFIPQEDLGVEPPVRPPPAADAAERAVREAVWQRRYAAAATGLRNLGGTAGVPAALAEEFAFLHWTDADRDVVAGLWGPIAAGNRFDLRPPEQTEHVPLDVAKRPEAAAVNPGAATLDHPVRTTAARAGSAVAAGQALEDATVQLFATFFALSNEHRDEIGTRVRKQYAGTQFGHDIELTCTVAGQPQVRCHVECKNVREQITLKHVGEKILAEMYSSEAPFDHWILISPHTEPANDLVKVLATIEHRDDLPFSVQIWSPANGVREFFALAPEVYQRVYGAPPPPGIRATQVVRAIRERLAPRLRLPRVWHAYLRDPSRHCFPTEKAGHFADLYQHQVEIKVADENGSVLEGSLMAHVRRWLAERDGPDLFLMADFGEGKSLFTYTLCRRLCEEFVRDPASGVLPLRLPLSGFTDGIPARELLQRRLQDVGATMADWRYVSTNHDTLVVLDGFDEMSVGLTRADIDRNVHNLMLCQQEFGNSKVLLTSRSRVLDSPRDRERILDRSRRPRVLYLSPAPRAELVRYLEHYATDEGAAHRLRSLRELYDPIDLAAKPLFLQMIRATLDDLPTDELTEIVLYRTYIDKSLREKIRYLHDADLRLTDRELIDNLLEILEAAAIELQLAPQRYVYLRDFARKAKPSLAELLWRMRDGGEDERSVAGCDDDATARIGIRSLLKGVPAPHPERWPVTFFHRSMQEYFVARALVRALRTDPDRARQWLDRLPPLPEITHFVAELLKESPDSTVPALLESFARSATIRLGTGYLGGHALTLLYETTGLVPDVDWSGLRLDGARLAGADLRGRRFVNTLLRHARLDNANLEGTDLRGADLEGVRLEETSPVVAVARLGERRIIAAYRDRTVREWIQHPGGKCESRVLAALDHDVSTLNVTPQGRLVALGGGMLSVLAAGADGWQRVVRFRVKSSLQPVVFGPTSALFAQELSGGITRAVWFDHRAGRIVDLQELDLLDGCYAQLDGVAYAAATASVVTVVVRGDGGFVVHRLDERRASCLGLAEEPDGQLLVAVGHQDGELALHRVARTAGELWRRRRHDSAITSVAFLGPDQIVTGGADRAVRLTPVADPDGERHDRDHVMRLTLRCRGVRVDGLTPESERSRLTSFAQAQ